jgi:hypothetical protein
MDYDLTYISGQAMAAVVPRSCRWPKAQARRRPRVAALIIGAEVAGRLVRSNFKASSVGGWHPVGTVGAVAAAAAAARLLKVPVGAIANVLGISASLASGISVNFGTMSKPLHAGNAARNGVMAALLGKGGFTAHAAALEAPSGYFSTFGRGLDVSFEPFRGSRQPLRPRQPRLDLKGYPCGGLTHTAIEQRSRCAGAGTRLNDVKNIHCFVTQRGSARRHAISDDGREREVQRRLSGALCAHPRRTADRGLHREGAGGRASRRWPRRDRQHRSGPRPGTDGSPARIRITFQNGEVLEERRDYAGGSTAIR